MSEPAPSTTPRHGTRREVFAFALYDWANSAYSTISITVLVFYIRNTLNAIRPELGTLVWAWGIALTMFTAAILSPILGAIADAHASKRRWLGATTFVGAGAACLMFFATPDRPWMIAVLFLVTHFNFELAQGFYNAFLPEVASEEDMGRISAWGYAFGYLGGALALIIAFMFFRFGSAIGIPPVEEDPTGLAYRLGLLVMGLWWGGFTIPTLMILNDRHPPRAERVHFFKAARRALGDVKATIGNIRRYRTLAIFLLAFLIYNDGVQTVITQASVFAESVLAMSAQELVLVILMIQFVAMPGAYAVGWAADYFGQKKALIACLLAWIVVLGAAYFVETKTQFWYLAGAVALVLGGIQSVSRAIMGLMTPQRHTAEFFGFFNFSGKATSIGGPMIFGAIMFITGGKARLALISLLVFFVIGTYIVLKVDVEQGRRDARESNRNGVP